MEWLDSTATNKKEQVNDNNERCRGTVSTVMVSAG